MRTNALTFWLKERDIFTQKVEFTLQDKKDKLNTAYKSYCGAFSTVFVYLIMLTVVVIKLDELFAGYSSAN